MSRLRPHLGSIDLLFLQVVGQRDVGRPRTAGGHRAEGAPHGVRNLVDSIDAGVPLGQRRVQRLLVQLGQRKLAARAD